MTKNIAFFRDENSSPGGHLINVSSIVGQIAFPLVGYYCASKHAIEGLTECVAAEVDPSWNIKFSILCPGNFRTPIVDNSAPTNRPIHSAYTAPELPSTALREWLKHPENFKGDPAKIAQLIYDIATSSSPAFRYFVGSDALQAMRVHVRTLDKQVEDGANLSTTTDYA